MSKSEKLAVTLAIVALLGIYIAARLRSRSAPVTAAANRAAKPAEDAAGGAKPNLGRVKPSATNAKDADGPESQAAEEISYDFDGAKKVRTARGLTVYRDSEHDEHIAYGKITQLEARADWEGLATFCEQQITKAPLWPTAYMCAGEAYMHKNQAAKACELLRKTVQLAAGKSDWEGASVMAHQLRCGAQ